MKLLLIAMWISLCALTSLPRIAQDAGSDTPQTGVALIKLWPPVYPPLAHQARITGDVKILVSILKDGSVESAHVVSGHRLLEQAALESAQKSTFECRRCDNGESYVVTYSFAIDDSNGSKPDPCCCSGHALPARHFEPQVNRFQDHMTVTITVEPVCICPDECEERWAEQHSHYRSLKCLYLWKCAFRPISIE